MPRRDSVSDEARSALREYEDGTFEILDSSPRAQSWENRLKSNQHAHYALLVLTMVALIHLHSFFHYGWKPLINTPFLVKTEPFILLLWLVGLSTIVYSLYRLRERYTHLDDYDSEYIALHSSWKALKALKRENLDDAIDWWETAGYWMRTDDYSGPDSLLNLYDEYAISQNKVELLRERLPHTLEQAVGTGVTEIILHPDDYPAKYQYLVTEFNKCYNANANSAAMNRLRKLVEHLLGDILRHEYSPEALDSSWQGLNERIDKFTGNTDEFRKYSNEVTGDKFKQSLRKARVQGNTETHELTFNRVDNEELDLFINDVLFSVEILRDIREQMNIPSQLDEDGNIVTDEVADNEYEPPSGTVNNNE